MNPSPSLHARIAGAFDDQELRTLCFDRFPAVYREFTTGMTHTQMIQILLDYCVRHNAGETLLDVLDEARPGLIGADRDALLAWLDSARLDPPSTNASDPPRQTIVNQASNTGAQGIFHAPVYIGGSPPTTPALHQLRAPVGDFVGREQEIAELVQAARSGAAAAISGVRGMGGIGKTELAYVVADQLVSDFPDAQIVVELRGATEPLAPSQALQSLIRVFEPESRLSDDLAELQAIYRSLLSGKRALILADDARDTAQVRPLLPPSGSALLVTSRVRFALPGMHAIDLGTLAPKEAEALLLAICPRIGEAAPALAKLCGYLPLALRVSAGLLASDTTLLITRYLKQLEDERQRLAGLCDGEDPALNVDASLALSYTALDSAAQVTLCQLSIFVADFDLGAAQAVVALEDEQIVESVLGDLYRRSLLDYDTTQERYSMHDLVRVFVYARLEADAALLLMLRYARYYEGIARQADELYFRGSESVLVGLGLFDRERAHIDAGWAWMCGQPVGSTIDSLLIDYVHATLHIGGMRYDIRQERIPRYEAALAAARRHGDQQAEGAWLSNLGNTFRALGEVRRAITYHEQALTIMQAIDDHKGVAYALGSLGNTYLVLGDRLEAITYYKQALAIVRKIGDRRGEGYTLASLGNVLFAHGEMEQAITSYEQALAIVKEIGDRRREGAVRGNLGNVLLITGNMQQAGESYEQALAIAREIGDRQGEVAALGNLGNIYLDLGNISQAIVYRKQALAIAREIGDRQGEGTELGGLGNAYYALRDVKQAIGYFEQSLAIAQEIGDRQGEVNILESLGSTYFAQGDVWQATTYYEQTLTIARQIHDRQAIAHSLMSLGMAYLRIGNRRKAAPCLHEAQHIFDELNLPPPSSLTSGLAVLRWPGCLYLPLLLPNRLRILLRYRMGTHRSPKGQYLAAGQKTEGIDGNTDTT